MRTKFILQLFIITLLSVEAFSHREMRSDLPSASDKRRNQVVQLLSLSWYKTDIGNVIVNFVIELTCDSTPISPLDLSLIYLHDFFFPHQIWNNFCVGHCLPYLGDVGREISSAGQTRNYWWLACCAASLYNITRL